MLLAAEHKENPNAVQNHVATALFHAEVILLRRALLPLLFANTTVGGQAVIEGVMMRSKNRLAIAVRKPDGQIVVELRPWFSLTHAAILKKPFVRGFPVLMETLVNGIKALNFSAMICLSCQPSFSYRLRKLSRSFASAWECSCETRPSVMSMTWAVSFIFNSSP